MGYLKGKSALLSPEEEKELIGRYLDFELMDKTFEWFPEDISDISVA